MPVPTSITDLSTTAASNSPAGADAVFPNLDDYLRAHAAFIAQLDDEKLDKAGDTMTGALTLNANASDDMHAVPKQQLDTGLAGKADSAHTHTWQSITSQLATDGTNTEDPNATTQGVMLTNHANSPAAGVFWTITTVHHHADWKSQIAIEMGGDASRVYARSKSVGVWYAWVRCDLGEGLTRSIGTNGYLKIPGAGGLMLQWGQFSHGGGGNVAVSFPIAFPNAAVAVVPNSVYGGGTNNPSAHSKSAGGFTCYWTGSVTITIDYIAIGY